jgi:hypothetical protein
MARHCAEVKQRRQISYSVANRWRWPGASFTLPKQLVHIELTRLTYHRGAIHRRIAILIHPHPEELIVVAENPWHSLAREGSFPVWCGQVHQRESK